MSSSANPQHEPTMEEILASIRKIISEDQPEAAKTTAMPEPMAVHAPAPQPVAAEADVLELTEEVPEEAPAPIAPAPAPAPAPAMAAPVAKPAPVPEPEPVMENDIAFETVETEPKAEPSMDDLISESARNAMGRAFAHLDRGSAELTAAGGGTLDALFLRAISDAFTPTLQEWIDARHAEILDGLKPLIREWMDENLPSLIETAVTKELTRAAAASRPRRR
jgi:cell pole-organizing protein PopZ